MNSLAWSCLILGSLAACEAAEFSVRTWDVDDGLPESGITDVIQSSDGYLWASTLNSGISRFDGVRFVNYEPPAPHELASHGIRRLFADADGTLWLNGFGNYLASVRGGKFQWEYGGPAVINWLVCANSGRTVFATKEGQLLARTSGAGTNAAWNLITAPGAGPNTRFCADATGDFWYRATNGALFRLHGEKAEHVTPEADAAPINTLAGDQHGAIAAGSAQKLLVWAGDGFRDATPTNGEPEIAVRGLVSDGQGGWWIEANNRLRRCQKQRWTAEAAEWPKQRRNWARVRWEQNDNEGGLWLAYADGGLVHVSAAGKLSAITTKEGLPSNRVRTMTEDREGNVWASFERGGLVRIRPRLFQAIGSREGLADIVTTSVCEDSNGAIWIGNLGGTVSRWSSGGCTNFTLPQQGTHCEMTTVFPGPDGRVWIGTHGNGLLVYAGGEFQHVLSHQVGVNVGVNIRGLFVSHDNHVWIASQDGLFCLFHDQVRQWLVPQSEADYPTAITEGASGKIWVAMNSGTLVCWQDNRTTSYEPPDPAMRCRFAAVCEDAAGTIWLGTLGTGLLRFHDGQFAALTTRNGLPSDNITQVLDDGAGHLWLGSPAGVISLPKRAAEAWLPGGGDILKCRAYGRDDGLPTIGCAIASQPTAWRGHDGRLWFATARGVASIQPPAAEAVARPPLVVLEELVVDGKPAPANNRPQNPAPAAPYFLASDRQAGRPITLEPGRHQLEFRYTGLSFNDPERIHFKYWLEGLDKTWMETGERTVSYHDIPPGDYRFRVQAQNSDGAASEAEASLAVIVPPHLWETRWFQAASLGAILMAVAGSVFGILQARHRRELRVLEHRHALEHERARIAQDIHDDLGAGLTRITMLSQSALDRQATAKPPTVELSRIYHTARSMTDAMDEIVWAINPSHDTLESLAAYFAEFVQEFLTPTGLKFNLEMPLALPPLAISSEVRHSLFLAFKEALNNIVKHAQATEVVVTLAVRPGGFAISVQDNGRGFDGESAPGKGPGPDRRGQGNGLRNMHRRLQELGGRCMVTSQPGHGSRVTLEVNLCS